MPIDCLRYAGLATLFATLAALPMAWLLAHRRFPGCELLNAAANLPLALPPAVLVYYLLATSGRWSLRFSWPVAVGVSAVYTFPLLIRMFRAALAAVDPAYENAARILGAGEWRIFWRVSVPLCWPALVAAVLTGFVRAFADFAATLIVSGTGSALLLLPVAAAAFACLYLGNRLPRARVPA